MVVVLAVARSSEEDWKSVAVSGHRVFCRKSMCLCGRLLRLS